MRVTLSFDGEALVTALSALQLPAGAPDEFVGALARLVETPEQLLRIEQDVIPAASFNLRWVAAMTRAA